MANSKYEYVREFELADQLLPNTWIVVRIDGRGFTKMCAKYGFAKPNDRRALELMNAAAKAVISDIPDVMMAYGMSDEFSFVFHKSCTLFLRRSSKLVSTVVSTFTAYYVQLWMSFFPDTPLTPPLPSFDGRAVCYPGDQNLRDYMSWRHVDCHINNLYNTTFWSLVQLDGMSQHDAKERLGGTVAADKNEILFSKFNINYNDEPEIFKKGSVIFRDYELVEPGGLKLAAEEANDPAEPAHQSKTESALDQKKRSKARIVVEHLDIVKDEFWDRRPWLLSNRPGRIRKET